MADNARRMNAADPVTTGAIPVTSGPPWQGIADTEGFSGDFTQKPGVFQVAPGGAHSHEMTIALVES